MHLENTGRGTYVVTSHGQDFCVDVLPHSGNGCCDCPHFLSRIKPEIERSKSDGTFHPGAKFRCPHINHAREHLLDLFIEQLNKTFPDAEPV